MRVRAGRFAGSNGASADRLGGVGTRSPKSPQKWTPTESLTLIISCHGSFLLSPLTSYLQCPSSTLQSGRPSFTSFSTSPIFPSQRQQPFWTTPPRLIQLWLINPLPMLNSDGVQMPQPPRSQSMGSDTCSPPPPMIGSLTLSPRGQSQDNVVNDERDVVPRPQFSVRLRLGQPR